MKRILIYQIFILNFFVLIPANINAQDSMVETSFNYGKKLFDEGFFDLTILQFQEFIEQFPTSPEAGDALFLLGESQYRLNQLGPAQKTYLKHVLQYPTHQECSKSHYRIAQCFERLGQIESAVIAFQRVNEFFPDDPFGLEGLYQAARLSLQLKKYDQARSILKKLWTRKISYDLTSRSQLLMADIDIKQSQFESAIQILKPLSETGIRKDDKIHAFLKLADVYEKLWMFDQCLPIYEQVIHESGNDSLRQIAYFKYGITAYHLNANSAAKQYFKMLTDQKPEFQEISKAYFYLGLIAEQQNQLESSISYFNQAIEHASTPEPSQEYRLYLAEIYLKAERYADAENQCRMLLDQEKTLDDKRQSALLLLSKSLLKQHREDDCLEVFGQYLNTYPTDAMNPYIMIKSAELYLDRGLTRQGWTLLRQIWERYPQHIAAPNAYYLYAKSLETEGDWSEGLNVRRILVDQYSGSIYADSAKTGIETEIQNPVLSNTDRMLKLQMFSYQTFQDAENPEKQFSYAGFLIDEMHLPGQAIPYLHKTMLKDNYQASSLYYLGKAYLQIAIFQRQKAAMDSAIFYFEQTVKQYPNAPEAADAALQYGSVSESRMEIIKIYKTLLAKINDVSKKCRLYRALGESYFEADSLGSAMHYFESWKNCTPGGANGLPQYYMACIQSRRGYLNTADSLFSQLQTAYPNHSRNASILFERAKVVQKMRRNELAAQLYRKIANDYQYSCLADSAASRLGVLLLKEKMYPEALDCYKRMLFSDSVRVLAYEMELTHSLKILRPEVLSGLAKAYKALGQYDLAKGVYYQYHKRYSGNDMTALMMDLTRIAEEQGNYPQAIRYINSALEKSPSDSMYQWLASLYEASGDYQQAYIEYQKALTKAQNPGNKVELNQKLILTLLKQDKLPEADTRINVFEKSFRKDDNYDFFMAEILLEEGKAQFRQKNFKQAEELFDRVRDKYKKTPFRALAEMEIGRTLIITNKIDDALKALIKMLTDYKDDPVYYQVYLNLGDLYFRQQQFENAINAFKTVLNDSDHVENQQLALRYLIRIYDSMGLSEAALALTRQYIQKFPEADDVVLKKVQIGNFYMRLKDYYRAIDQFEKTRLIADDETEAEIQYWIGKCYAEMGRFDQAILEYLKVKYISKPTKLPWASTAMYEAAMAYLKLYKPFEAKVIFEKIVRYEGATSDLGRIAKQRIDEIDQGKYAEAD